MADFPKDRMAVLSPEVVVPELEEMEVHFAKFLIEMRRRLYGSRHDDKFEYGKDRKVRSLAKKAHERRLRTSGLEAMKVEVRRPLVKLAQGGGKLSGPSTEDEVYRLAAALHAESPWMRDVSAWVMTQMLQHVAAGGHGLALPPMILAGSPGIGKSHYAHMLADLVGLPVRMIDVGGGSAGFRISGTEAGWGSARPGIPVETVVATGVANPILVVDEIDKAGTLYSTRGVSTSITTSMLQMLEPGTSQRFECSCYRLRFDMSRIVWIMTANDPGSIPAPLRDRSRLFVLPKLSADDAVAHFDRLTADCVDEAELIKCRAFLVEMSNRAEGVSLRQIQKLADASDLPMPRMVH